MNAQEFTYWLQGFVELANTSTISDAQWTVIKDHLALVFNKVTPTVGIRQIPEIKIGDDQKLFPKLNQFPNIDTTRTIC